MPSHTTRSHQATNLASAHESPAESARKTAYGLPCSRCRLYYPADLDACPHCHHRERVSPAPPKLTRRVVQPATSPTPASTTIDDEREEFLRQFKSQLQQAHAEVVNAPGSACKLPEHHASEAAAAEVCKPCYERLQERLDVCEAALHMDLKEAAQIVYKAVWSDPSDTDKTYQNAASALLTELRKRAGINTVLGPFQPLSH